MKLEIAPALSLVSIALALLLFLIGLICLLTQRNIIKQVIGLRIMFQGAALSLLLSGYVRRDVHLPQMMVISAMVAETIVIAIALALIVNVFHHYRSGDVDYLSRLKG